MVWSLLGGKYKKIYRFHLSFTSLVKIILQTWPYAQLAWEFVSFREEIRVLFGEDVFSVTPTGASSEYFKEPVI